MSHNLEFEHRPMVAKQSHFRRAPFQIGKLRSVWCWAADERGSILIEAAIICPVLLIIFLGMVEFSQALTVKRRVQNVASSTADLVAQSQSVTTADLNDIASMGVQLMLPFSSTGLSLTLTSVAEDANSKITVQWSCSWSRLSNSPNCAAGGSTFTGLPTGLLNPGQSLIIGQTSYPYTPAIGEFLTGGLTFSSTFYFRPRLVTLVVKQ
jgi:Flp pilus assembly protein TadG